MMTSSLLDFKGAIYFLFNILNCFIKVLDE